jgi:hypothetical protein
MGTDPYRKIRPDVLPADSEVSSLISRHNGAANAADRMEGLMADWTAGNLPSLSMDEVSGTREDIARERRIAEQTADELDRLGYDPHDYRWGRRR